MKLLEKIATIQREIGKLTKDKEGYNYKYVDLDQILENLEPLLEKHKVFITQPLKVIGEKTALFTVVHDLETETTEESSIFLPDGVKPQDMGSAQTYYRRYSLVSLFMLRAEDDDGASASNIKTAPKGKTISKSDNNDIL